RFDAGNRSSAPPPLRGEWCRAPSECPPTVDEGSSVTCLESSRFPGGSGPLDPGQVTIHASSARDRRTGTGFHSGPWTYLPRNSTPVITRRAEHPPCSTGSAASAAAAIRLTHDLGSDCGPLRLLS